MSVNALYYTDDTNTAFPFISQNCLRCLRKTIIHIYTVQVSKTRLLEVKSNTPSVVRR